MGERICNDQRKGTPKKKKERKVTVKREDLWFGDELGGVGGVGGVFQFLRNKDGEGGRSGGFGGGRGEREGKGESKERFDLYIF